MSRIGWIGLSIVTIMLLTAILSPVIAPYNPFDPASARLEDKYQPPNKTHWLGTDRFGKDVLSNMIYGARISLLVGITATLISAIIGLILGSLAGYIGKWIDDIIMRLTDITFAFPGLLLAIAMAAFLGPSIKNVIIALSATGWAGYTRLIRGEILSLKERDYIQASVSIGASSKRIILRHIWPNLMSPLLITATFGIAGAIIGESALSFLGLGAPLGTPSWGAMLNEGRRAILTSPYLSIFPGLAIMMAILGFNFLGDALRDRFDPKTDALRRVITQ